MAKRKEIVVPPIKGNPRIGRETQRDASVVLGGASLPTPTKSGASPPRIRPSSKGGAARRRRQTKFTLPAATTQRLEELAKRWDCNKSVVIAIAVAQLAKVEGLP